MSSKGPPGFLSVLWERIAPKLSIQMSPESFTVSNGEASLTIPTFLYAEPAPGSHKVLVVGEVPVASPGQVRVDLFGTLPPEVDRGWALEVFLKHAIQRALPKYALISPSITVTGLDALGMVRNEDKVGMLLQALGKAGARRVELPERKETT